MPTIRDYQKNTRQTMLLSGLAGSGKTTLALQAEGPIAVLCVDKPVPGQLPNDFPGYDPGNVFYKSYQVSDVDLTDDRAPLPRNVADAVYRDILVLKNLLISNSAAFVVDGEQWPRPRTIIFEGGDFLADHVENWVLAVAGKQDATEFEDRFEMWRKRLKKLASIYSVLAHLPSMNLCNVIVTTGLHEESLMKPNARGKMELQKTGVVDPELGGKLNTDGPRIFANSWLCVCEAGKYFVITKPVGKYAKYRGIRSGHFGLADMEDVTIDKKNLINHWQRLTSLGIAQP